MAKYYCYIVSAGKFVKIGYSCDLDVRMETIRTSCPFQVNLLTAFPFTTEAAAREQEKELHFRFRKFHVRGEWFLKSPVLKFIRKEKRNNVSRLFLPTEQFAHMRSILSG